MTNGSLRLTTILLADASIVSRQASIAPPPFQPFGAQHLLALASVLALAALAGWAAAVWKPSPRKWLGRLLGLLLLAYVGAFYVQQAVGHSLSWEYSLPLDLCSLVLAACILTLFRPNPFTAEIAYFWGLGGTLHAVATPDLACGFPSWEYLFFFWGHGASLLAIAFMIGTGIFRPRRGSVRRMMISVNIYALAVGAVDALAGWNYGYLCRKPPGPSLLDHLGPWPWYLLSLEGIALLSFFLLDMPWRLLRWFRAVDVGTGINGGSGRRM